MGTLRFEIRTDKIDEKGTVPVRLVYQIKKQRVRFNTGLKCFPINWSADNQRFIFVDKKTAKAKLPAVDYDLLFTGKEVDAENNKLADLTQQIKNIEQRFELDKTPYDAEMVIDKLKENKTPIVKKTEPRTFFYDFVDQYIQDHDATRKRGSLTVYKSMKRHLQNFEKAKRKKVSFEKIDYSFFQSFQNYLIGCTKVVDGKEVPLMNNITIAKQLSTIKTFLNYAKKQGVHVPDRYKDFKIKKESLEVIALTNDEFETLYYLDIKNKKLAQVRDAFCFSCATGLRYSDLRKLNRDNIKNDEIKITVFKTAEPLTIALTNFAKSILSKYNDRYAPLPVISNQKMNEYLKELCKLAEINDPVEIVRYRGAVRESQTYPKYELVSAHTGRKTYVTVSLELGVPTEVVMANTGHRDYKSFQRYVKVTEQRKKTVMLKAWDGGVRKLKVV